MIYNKIERVLVITKQIFNYYNTNFSPEITSKVQKVNQKYTFTHKLTTKRNFQTTSLFFSSTVTEWNGIWDIKDSKIDQMKVSHETGSEANFGFGHALIPSYLGMCPPKAAFFSFRMQPKNLVSIAKVVSMHICSLTSSATVSHLTGSQQDQPRLTFIFFKACQVKTVTNLSKTHNETLCSV